MKPATKGILAGIVVCVLGCAGFGYDIASSFPAHQGPRIDAGAFVGVETGGAYAWVVPSQTGVVLIDAGMDTSARALKAEIGDRPVHAVFITHGHLDHVAGLGALSENVAYVGPGEAPVARGERPARGAMARVFGMLMGYPSPPPELVSLRDEEVVQIDGIRVRSIHLPGHTGGSMAYVIGDTVFTGDAALGHPDRIAPVHGVFCDDHAEAVRSLQKLVGVAERLADGHAGVHSDLQKKLGTR